MTRRQRIADLATFALPSQPTLSPDGREVVYVLTTVDAAADKNVMALREKSDNAATDEEGHKALREYNKALFEKMRSLEPSLGGRIDRLFDWVL